MDVDFFTFSMGGGGGYGDVLERNPQAVLQDLKEGMITKEVAEKIYRVAIDDDTGLLDAEKTEQMRVTTRRERLRKGKRFDAFMKEWRRLKPPKEILKYYGNWPEPRLDSYDEPFWGLYK
jgi:acetone carboxylase alpha subunit